MRPIFYLLCFFIISACNTQKPKSFAIKNSAEKQFISFDGFERCFYDPEMVDLKFIVESVGQNIETTAEIHKKN